jgi:hypothetical protein
VLPYTRVESLVRDKHYNLLGALVNYKKKLSVMNTAPKLGFLHKLGIGPRRLSVKLLEKSWKGPTLWFSGPI